MTSSCPVLTPAERQVVDIIARADKEMMAKVLEAVEDARNRVRSEFMAIGSSETPPYNYFASVVHRQMFCLLCGANPHTFQGGDPAIAARLLESGHKISDHYWSKREMELVSEANTPDEFGVARGARKQRSIS